MLTFEQTQIIFDPSTDSYNTLLNPDNMRAFFKQYKEGMYTNLYNRFSFTSQEQCDMFYEYLLYIIKYSLNQGNPVENSAFGSLVERTLNTTYATLNATFPLEVTVRNMAQNIYSSTGLLSCDYFVSQAVTDPVQLALICDQYDFSNVEDLKLFTNATWYVNNTVNPYGGFYTDQLQIATTMDDSQIATFFDLAN
jgi:hypothetical protein